MQETEETQVRFSGQEGPPAEGVAAHSSVLAWRSPWTEEPVGATVPGAQTVRHDWATWHAPTVVGPGVAWRGCWRSAVPTPKAALRARGGAQYPASPPTPVLAPALQKWPWCFSASLYLVVHTLPGLCTLAVIFSPLYSFFLLCCWRRCLSRRSRKMSQVPGLSHCH